MDATAKPRSRYGMTIDLDRCNGCGACMVACSVENNVPPVPCEPGDRKGITWIRVYKVTNGGGAEGGGVAWFPVTCQHCERHTPCIDVCPQNAVELDPETGVVGQIAVRCLGCRYCMAACPYHARYFNWWDPAWPQGTEPMLNPGVSPRMRGVVEKCNFCHARLQEAREKAAAQARRDIDPADYVPACAQACPMGAITFGDLNDPDSEVSRLARSPEAFRLLEKLGTEPKVWYLTRRPWVRRMADNPAAALEEDEPGGQRTAR